jgi:3-deoxy-7-phosphoheptulonate synthase
MLPIQDQLHNVNVVSSDLLATPDEVKRRMPLTESAADTVLRSRALVRAILERQDPRLFVVVGPCSIHDVAAAREYADRLRDLASRVESTLILIMRVYFEKPRTTVGWKGLINDPDLDDSFHIEKGIYLARELLLYIAELGLPAGTEALDPIMPQYL